MRRVNWAVVLSAGIFLAGPASAQVVFNEILLEDAAGLRVNQLVELKNTSTSSVNIGGWILGRQGDFSAILPANVTLPAGGILIVHFNQAGTSGSSEVYFPGKVLDDVSDLSLYRANSLSNGGFSNPDNIRAFVQWGGIPQNTRQSVAQNAGLWTSNTWINTPPAGHSVELCSGTGISPSSYFDQATPSIGSNNSCQVCVQNVSWGKVKAIFQ
jgi:hypothetical protein